MLSPAAVCVTADEAVSEMYGAKMTKNFGNHGVEVHYVVLPGEEASEAFKLVLLPQVFQPRTLLRDVNFLPDFQTKSKLHVQLHRGLWGPGVCVLLRVLVCRELKIE